MRVVADVHRCEAHGFCVDAAPDVFELDADDVVVVPGHEIAEAVEAKVRAAVRACPVAVLRIER